MAPKKNPKLWQSEVGQTEVDGVVICWRLSPAGYVNPRAGSLFDTFQLSAKKNETAADVPRRLQAKLSSAQGESREGWRLATDSGRAWTNMLFPAPTASSAPTAVSPAVVSSSAEATDQGADDRSDVAASRHTADSPPASAPAPESTPREAGEQQSPAFCLPDTQIEEAEDAEPQPEERLGSPSRMELDGADSRSAITPTGSPSIGAPTGSNVATDSIPGHLLRERPVTRGACNPVVRFSESEHSTFSSYELGRLNARHDRTRDESYDEVRQRAEQITAERDQQKQRADEYEARLMAEAQKVRDLMGQLEQAVEAQKLPAEERSVAEQLQQAVATMIDEKNSSEQVRLRLRLSSKGLTAGSKPCRFRWAVEVTDECEDSLDDSLLDRDEWAAATAEDQDTESTTRSPRLRVCLADSKQRGVVTVIGDEFLWGENGASIPCRRVPLAEVTGVEVQKRRTPFENERLHVSLEDDSVMVFVSEWPAPRVQEFTDQLRERAAAAVTAETAARVRRRCETRVRTTARVRAGRELYSKLHEVGQLRHDHKMKQAAELFAQLHSPPGPTDEKAEAREDGLARRRACELRDFTFSFGGLSLTRQVLQRLLEMREVRSALPTTGRPLCLAVLTHSPTLVRRPRCCCQSCCRRGSAMLTTVRQRALCSEQRRVSSPSS